MTIDGQSIPALLKVKEALALTRLSYAQTRRLIKKGLHPNTVKLSDWAVAFVAEEIHAWIASRITARDTGADSGIREKASAQQLANISHRFTKPRKKAAPKRKHIRTRSAAKAAERRASA
jgi:predicted DNA-binding transcriptional regulator AlpA